MIQRPPLRRRLWPLAVPLVLVAALLGPQLLALRSFAPTNMLYLYWPWSWDAPEDPGIRTAGPFADNWDNLIPFHAQVAARLLHGDLPLWSPLVAGGADLLPNLGSMALAPSTLLWVLLPDWYVSGLVKVLEIFGAWGFLFLFLRRTGVSRGPATIAGLAFATAGFQVVWFSWPHTVVNMLVAGTLWAWDRVRERPSDPLRLGVAALMTAAAILEGFPAVAAIGLGTVCLVLVVRVLAEWPGWAGALRSAAGVGASAALGIGITMIVLLPFSHLLSMYELTRGLAKSFPAQSTISTVLSPNSWGAADGFFGPFNYIELVGYLAPAALVLLIPGLLLVVVTRRRVALTLTALAIGSVLYLYAYGFEPFYSLLRGLPVFSSNAPTRAKAAGAVMMALAIGVALDALFRGGAGRRVRWIAVALTLGGVVGGAALLVLVSQKAPAVHAAFVRGEVARAVLVMVLAGAVALALLRHTHPSAAVRRTAVVLILTLMLVDAVAWIRPYWPTSRPADFYPQTTAHQFVERELGTQRLAGSWVTFWPGTNGVYGFRTMTGHLFHRPVWRDVIEAAGGRMNTPTFSLFDQASSAVSPVLDRFGVSLWADQTNQRRCTTHPTKKAETTTLRAGEELTVDAGAGLARGVAVRLAQDTTADTQVTVTADGRHGVARVAARTKAGKIVYLPVPEPGQHQSTVTFRVATVDGAPLVVHASNGQPLASCVRRRPDGLRLEYTEGAFIYRRLNALPRIRWASGALVETDAQRRLDLLAAGTVADDTVVLDRGPAHAPHGTGSIESLDDGDDETTATVSTSADGWLVIADPKQDSWRATVDGQDAPIVAADHAGIAIAVPKGTHVVHVWDAPAGLRTGAAITGVSLAITVALLLVGVVRRRGPRPPVSAGLEPSAGRDPNGAPDATTGPEPSTGPDPGVAPVTAPTGTP